LLDRAAQLREGIDWRRSALINNDPVTDRVAVERLGSAWQKKHFGAELARLELLEKDLVHVSRTRNVLMTFQANCSDPKILAQAQTPEAKAHKHAVERAEAAAAGQPLR
jgi:hypothetical protein